MVGFFFVWWFDTPRVVSAYALRAKPTYGQTPSPISYALCVSGIEGLTPVVQTKKRQRCALPLSFITFIKSDKRL